MAEGTREWRQPLEADVRLTLLEQDVTKIEVDVDARLVEVSESLDKHTERVRALMWAAWGLVGTVLTALMTLLLTRLV